MPFAWGDLLAGLIEGLARFLKGIFGWDKAQQTQVTEVKPDKPVETRSDDELLKELGIKTVETPEKEGDGQ